MTLTKDTPVRTRDGREAEILAEDMGGDFPILARFQNRKGHWVISRHLEDGTCATRRKELDLIPIRPERVVWINEYEKATATAHETQAKANEMSDLKMGFGGHRRLAIHRITLSEDTVWHEGDDE